MQVKRWIIALSLLAIAITSNGCFVFLLGAGAAVGAGTVAYVGGELKVDDNVTVDRAWNASLRAMSDLQFKVSDSQKDALAGKIVAHRADGTRIYVRVERQSDDVTEIKIRVGTFGDEALSRLIYDKIKGHY